MNKNNDNNEYERLEVLAEEYFNVIASSLSQFGCMDSLVFLKRFIKSMRLQKKPIFTFRNQSMGFHVFPFFADMIIRYCTMMVPTRKFNEDTLAWFIDKYVNFPEILQLDGSAKKVNKYVPEWLIRTAFEQISIQEMTRTLVPRMLFFYREIPEKNTTKHNSFIRARDEVLERLFRVNLDDVLLCTFTLGAITDAADRFTEELSTEVEWMKKYVESDAMKIILEQFSLTRDEYISQVKKEFSDSYIYVRTEPQLIHKYPLIRFEEYYVTPDSHMILARITKYLHDSVYQYFIDNDRIQDYSSNFGEVFKDYIGLLLTNYFSEQNVINLDNLTYITGRKADWLVITDDIAIIIECKAQRYPKKLKKTGKLDILESFVNKRIDSAVEQLINTNSQWQKIANKENIIKDVNHVYKFILFEEQFQFGNVIEDFIPNNKTIQKMNENGIKIISTLDIETIITSKFDVSFSTMLREWFYKIKEFPTLGQFLHTLNGFEYTDDNIIDEKFKSFFHME